MAAACVVTSKSRYRQWMTHKLGTWIDQFGTSGCVGCGRCITWCPVGIDITEEVRAIRDMRRAASRRVRPNERLVMMIQTLEPTLIQEHPFFAGLDDRISRTHRRMCFERALRGR